MLTNLALMAGLLVLSALFSASETALFSLSRRDLRQLRHSPGFVHNLILRLHKDPQSLLSTVLFGNMSVNTLYCSLATLASLEAGALGLRGLEVGIALGSLVALIICGEVAPKVAAVAAPMRLSHITAPPLFLFRRVLSAVRLRQVFGVISDIFVAPFSRREDPPHVTWDELHQLMQEARTRSGAAPEVGGAAHELVEFPGTRVAAVMLARAEAAAVDVACDLESLRALVREKRAETVLVHEGGADNLVGMVFAREVLLGPPGPLRSYLRPLPVVVQEDAPLEAVLHEVWRQRAQVAVVVDASGAWTGLVSAASLVEELVLLLRFGRIFKEGDVVRMAGLQFTIRKMRGRRIADIRVDPVPGPDLGENL